MKSLVKKITVDTKVLIFIIQRYDLSKNKLILRYFYKTHRKQFKENLHIVKKLF